MRPFRNARCCKWGIGKLALDFLNKSFVFILCSLFMSGCSLLKPGTDSCEKHRTDKPKKSTLSKNQTRPKSTLHYIRFEKDFIVAKETQCNSTRTIKAKISLGYEKREVRETILSRRDQVRDEIIGTLANLSIQNLRPGELRIIQTEIRQELNETFNGDFQIRHVHFRKYVFL
ncbi:MAG: flagellar basal body-associated protein FliL [bacterium]